MKRGRRILLILVACGVVGLSAALLTREKEPEYQGRKLSQWLTTCCTSTNQVQREEAEAAVKNIGPAAVPCLTRWACHRPLADRGWPGRVALALPGARVRAAALRWVNYGRSRAGPPLAQLAAVGFKRLGPEARAAVPALTQAMRASRRPYDVAMMLCWIGPDGIGPVVQYAGEPQCPDRRALLNVFLEHEAAVRPARLGTNSLGAVSAVARCVRDKDEETAASAVHLIGMWKVLPEICVPALTNAVCDSRPSVRLQALEELAGFGEERPEFAWALSRALNDPDSYVRFFATRYFSRSTPEGAKVTNGMQQSARQIPEGGGGP